MLTRFGDFLGTTLGFWVTMAVTVLCGVAAIWATDAATFVLSVVAIILPSIILVRDAARSVVASERDKALHAKIDGIVHGVKEVDDELAGIEPDEK